MEAFEEVFKTKAQDTEADRQRWLKMAEARKKRGVSIIDVNRARNLCMTSSFNHVFSDVIKSFNSDSSTQDWFINRRNMQCFIYL